MRRIFTIYPALCLGLLLLFASCKKEEPQAIVTNGTPGTVTASSSTIVLNKAKSAGGDTSVIFNIVKANFGYSAAIGNVLQIDSMGDNWKKPQAITMAANASKQVVSTLDFNTLLLKLNLAPSKPAQIQVRLVSSVSNNLTSGYSPVITMTVTPFSIASSVYVPGAYQGWAPTTADSLVSATSNGIYSGIISFTGSDLTFKITNEKDWNGISYGAGSAPGTTSTTGGNLTAPLSAGLLVTLNINNNTITYTPQWSIIGDATAGGWGADTDMYYDKSKKLWYITATLVSDGTQAMKFRFANDWTVNLGGGNGTLTQGGGNITIPKTAAAGDVYKITLDPVANTYTLLKQ
jgi:starch-binding outer membrane protein SusE/F